MNGHNILITYTSNWSANLNKGNLINMILKISKTNNDNFIFKKTCLVYVILFVVVVAIMYSFYIQLLSTIKQ